MFTKHLRLLRSGTTTVETAVILPIFFMLLFAIFEFGHAQLVNNMLNTACRNGARLGAVEGTSTTQVEAHVNQVMGSVTPSQNVTVFVKDAGIYDSPNTPPADGNQLESLPDVEIADIESRSLFVVRARVAYNDIAIVPMPFLKDVVLDAQAFMRHE